MEKIFKLCFFFCAVLIVPGLCLAIGEPAPPVLTSPAHNANVAGTSVTLSWNGPLGATQYMLWVRRTSDNGVIFNQNIGNKTSYSLTGLSNSGDNYYWMVRAGNNSGWSKWTAARRFYNSTAAIPAPPILSSPAANANVAGTSVNLSWSASAGSTQYWLWVRRTSDNMLIFNQNIGNKTSYSLTGLPNNGGNYYWMVRAGNISGWSKWTVARRFFNGAASCVYSISSSSGRFTSSGGTGSVLVTVSSSSCSWTASENLSWVSLSPTSGTGSGAISVTVAANTGAAKSGSITIAGKTYTVSQAAPLAYLPEYDVYDVACRLQNVCNIPKTLPGPAVPLTVGTTKQFWLDNSDTNETFQINATLLYITPRAYFWAEKGVVVNQHDMKALMDTFDQKIIPTDREFFGSEWTPGVDNDPHIYVLYASNIGSQTAGCFFASDEYTPQVNPYSNGHEMFALNSSQSLADAYTYSTLAHEFVHMIQWAADRNETDWLQEGFAELGAFLNGYGVGNADFYYTESPDLQLNSWVDIGSSDSFSHYGQKFLYITYFLDRFGIQATKALNTNPANDLASVDDTLRTVNAIDPQTGKVITADDVFMDWAAALYLLDGTVGDGRYTYHNYPDAPQPSDTETISNCPQSPVWRDVHQFGIDYINISCAGEHTLTFKGSTAVQMFPVSPKSGSYEFATNRGNYSDMTLTRDFDFTNVSGSITLSFSMWYDLEQDYDYVYLEVSEDGEHWQILTTPSGTDENPSGNSYGWGYNGASHFWIQENVDFSKYAGKKVKVRFEYITDAAVTGEGFLLDDVSVDATHYHSDFEADDGGWLADGFSRTQNIIPQTFRLALIKKTSTGNTVQAIALSSNQRPCPERAQQKMKEHSQNQHWYDHL